MFAVIRTGGKQYKVSPGDTLQVERIDAAVGDAVDLAQVLLVSQDGQVQVGTPNVAGALVKATVVAQKRTAALIVFKKKRRQNYRRKKHQRQLYTVLKIDAIKSA